MMSIVVPVFNEKDSLALLHAEIVQIAEKANLDVVHTLCDILDQLAPRKQGGSYREQITYVVDRPGHDRRYAIDARKIERELGWRPAETFETGIRKTVRWYLDNAEWVQHVQSGAYRDWVSRNYDGRDAPSRG